MMQLHKYPLVRIALPFAAGIWFAAQFSISFPLLFYGIAILFILLTLWLVALRLRSYPLRWIYGMLLTIMLFIAGMAQIELRNPWRIKNHFMQIEDKPMYYLARLSEPPQQRAKSTRVQLSIQGIVTAEGEKKPAAGKIIAYLPIGTAGLKYGDLILFNSSPDFVAPPLNPHQFDYRSYLARSGILHQVFLKDANWKKIGLGYTNPLFSTAFHLRNYLLDALQKAGLDGDEFYVASAILLGYDDHLPAYLRQSYTAAGGMHVLCVSGLHVGIVYLFFSFILVFPGRNKKGKIFKAVIILLILWFYALLTGLSPSVIRASTMFSFMLIGKTFHKKGYIINTLAGSAFFLLWFDPQALFHIGFQLSYAAVVGIVMLQKPVYSIFHFRNWLLNKSWEATSVAIAAQIATTPFILYYFGQFPTYFILSNLILAPLSFIVIVTGMILLLISPVPLIASYVGWALSSMIYVMNYLITSIESFPSAVLQPLYIPVFAALLLAVLIIQLFYIPSAGWKKFTIPLLSTSIVFLFVLTTNHIKHLQQSQLTIYGIPKHTVIDFVHGKHHIVYADSVAMNDPFIIDFFLKKNWMVSGLTKNRTIIYREKNHSGEILYKNQAYFEFNGKTLAIWRRESGKVITPSSKLKVDILLVSGNTPEQLSKLITYYDFDQIVFDLTVPPWHLEKWKTALNTQNQSFYDIKANGAFVLKP